MKISERWCPPFHIRFFSFFFNASHAFKFNASVQHKGVYLLSRVDSFKNSPAGLGFSAHCVVTCGSSDFVLSCT